MAYHCDKEKKIIPADCGLRLFKRNEDTYAASNTSCPVMFFVMAGKEAFPGGKSKKREY